MSAEEVLDDDHKTKRPHAKPQKAQRVRKMSELGNDGPQARRGRHGDDDANKEKARMDGPEAVHLDILAPLITPPPWLTDKFRIVDDDYGADDYGFDECGVRHCMSHPATWYSWLIPNSSPRRWFYTQHSWFEPANLPKRSHIPWTKEVTDQQVGYDTDWNVYKVQSPQGRTYVCKHTHPKEAMMSLIASVLDMSPRIYDIWYDDTRADVCIVTELMPNGALYPETEGYVYGNNPRLNGGFTSKPSDERWGELCDAKVDLDNNLHAHGLHHCDFGDRNIAWHKGRVFALDWGWAEIFPRAGTIPTPYMFQDIPLNERRRLAETYMSDWTTRSKHVAQQLHNRNRNIPVYRRRYFK